MKKCETTTDITGLKIWVNNETNKQKQSDDGTSACSVITSLFEDD